MSKQDGLIFGTAGLLTWAAATAYYVAFGDVLLERAFWFYAANAFLAGATATFLYQAVLRLGRTPRRRRPLAAALFIAPGLIGGAVMLIVMPDLVPHLERVSLGRYAAFLLVGYAMIAGAAFEPRVRAASPAR